MGFGNILGTIGTIGGGIIGGMYGGPAGATAGASIGGSLGGLASPNSGGGTSPASGRALGSEALAYYDAAFLDTNQWERLGAGNPMGAVSVQASQARNQQKMQRKELLQKGVVAASEIANRKNIAAMTARAAGVHSSVAAGSGASAKSAGDYIATGKGDPQLPDQTAPGRAAEAHERGSIAAEHQAMTAQQRMLYERQLAQARTATQFKSVTDAMSAGAKLQAFQIAMRDTSWKQFMSDHASALKAIGMGKDEVSGVLAALGVGGAIKALQRAIKGGRGGKSSVPASKYAPDTPANKAFNERLRKHRGE